MTQELALNWDGIDIEADNARLTRLLFGAPVFAPLAVEYPTVAVPGYGALESGLPTPLSRNFSFVVQVTPKNADPVRARGAAFDELRTSLGPLLSPEKPRVKALWTRPDGVGGTVQSFLWARTNGEPGWQYTATGGDGAAGMRPSGRMRVPVEAVATFPYFVDNEPSTNGTLTVGSPVVATNPGTRWVGWRLEILSSNADGSQVTLTSGEQSVTLQWSTPAIQDGTIVEYWYPAADLGHPLGVYSWRPVGGVYLRAQAVPLAGGSLVLGPGFAGPVVMTLPGTTTGAVTANFMVHAVYGSL